MPPSGRGIPGVGTHAGQPAPAGVFRPGRAPERAPRGQGPPPGRVPRGLLVPGKDFREPRVTLCLGGGRGRDGGTTAGAPRRSGRFLKN